MSRFNCYNIIFNYPIFIHTIKISNSLRFNRDSVPIMNWNCCSNCRAIHHIWIFDGKYHGNKLIATYFAGCYGTSTHTPCCSTMTGSLQHIVVIIIFNIHVAHNIVFDFNRIISQTKPIVGDIFNQIM